MDVQNIRLLHEKPYRVSWKADGTRYAVIVMITAQIACSGEYLIRSFHHVVTAVLAGNTPVDTVCT